MASLDWASVSNNLTRQVMVLALESPEMFEQLSAIAEAANCAADALQLDEPEEESTDGEENWDIWEADEPSLLAADAGKAIECIGVVDEWASGKIAGKLFARIFDQELKPNV